MTHILAIKSASGSRHLNYEEYLRLLIEQDNVHDSASSTIRGSTAWRSINNAEMYDTIDPDELDIDTPVSHFLVNQASFQHQRPSQGGAPPSGGKRHVKMDCDTWYSLPNADQDAWDKIDSDSKTKILSYAMKKAAKTMENSLSVNQAETTDSEMSPYQSKLVDCQLVR